jgi:hypothetical protein
MYQNVGLLLILIERVVCFSVEVSSGQSECFVVKARSGGTCSGSFEILSPNPRPVAVKVFGPEPLRITYYETKFSGQGAVDETSSEGNFLFEAESDGDYTMCLTNGNQQTKDGLTRVIAFNFRVKDRIGERDYEHIEMESEITDLVNGLNFLRDHQHYMNERETIHRGILSKIQYKFVLWSIIEYGLLIVISLWQIHSILSLFESKRRV